MSGDATVIRWRRLRAGELDHESLWLAVSLGAVALGAAWLHLGLPLPQCAFRAWTSCPCPTCGTTRAATQLLHGNFRGAWHFNPLATSAMAAITLFDLYAVAVLAGRLPRLRIDRASPHFGRSMRVAAGAAVLVNWAWLILTGI